MSRDRSDRGDSVPREVISAWMESGVSYFDIDGDRWVGESLWKRFGVTPRRRSIDAMLALVHENERDTVRRMYAELVSGEETSHRYRYRILLPGGRIHWIESEWSVVRAADGRRYIARLDRDATRWVERESELREARRRAESIAYEADVLRRAGAAITSTLDVDQMVSLILDQAKAVVPYDTASVQLLRDGYLEIVGGAGWDRIEEALGVRFEIPGDNPNTRVMQSKMPLRLDELYPQERTPPAEHEPGACYSWMGIPLIVRGEPIGMLTFDNRRPGYFTKAHLRLAASFADHVAIALHNAQLFDETQQLAMTDSLTGLLTRRAFFLNAAAFLEHARRYRHTVALLIIDIDYFKGINDTHGHQKGDAVLVQVSRAISEALRDSDIVGRYGGEEFIAMMTETTTEHAVQVAERVRRTVEALEFESVDSSVTVSIGVAPREAGTNAALEDLVEGADRACYLAKSEGRNSVRRADLFSGE